MAIPANIGTGTIRGTFGDLSGDAPDGTVTLTPSVKVLLDATSTPPQTVFTEPIKHDIVAGVLADTSVIATDDPDWNPSGWTYAVDIKLGSYARSFNIAVPEGAVIDLTTASPVPASGGASIVRGPGVPPGGTTGQVLAKASPANDDTEWVDVSGLTPPALDEITDVEVAAVTDGQTLTYDAGTSTWRPASPSVSSVNGKTGTVNLTFSDVGAKPTSYVPGWNDITSKPTEFPPSSHTHAVSEVDGLQADLDGKADIEFVGSMRFRGYGAALPASGNQEGDVFLLTGPA